MEYPERFHLREKSPSIDDKVHEFGEAARTSSVVRPDTAALR
jgi:hypothetical protein